MINNNVNVPIIVSVDHGNSFIKGHGIKYPSFCTESQYEQILSTNTIKYKGRYFTVTDGRFPMMSDKTQDEKYFILTLPTVAITLRRIGLRKANICIAAGLPIIYFSSLKESFKQYLLKDNIIFEFEGEEFNVSIKEVFVFPQGYSSIFSDYSKYKDMNAITVDWGSGTVDFFYMYKGTLDVKRTGSYNSGIIQLFNYIKQEVLKKQILLDETQIQELVKGEKDSLFIEEDIRKYVKEKSEEYVNKILNQLKEDGFDLKVNPVLFVGGGAELLKDYLSSNKNLNYYEIMPEAEFGNVKGYEVLARQKINALVFTNHC